MKALGNFSQAVTSSSVRLIWSFILVLSTRFNLALRSCWLFCIGDKDDGDGDEDKDGDDGDDDCDDDDMEVHGDEDEDGDLYNADNDDDDDDREAHGGHWKRWSGDGAAQTH